MMREVRRVLILSHARRAEAHFNLGEAELAEQDLTAVLAIEPGWAASEGTTLGPVASPFRSGPATSRAGFRRNR